MLCIGQSHMACVLAAAARAGTPLPAIGLREGRYLGELEQTLVIKQPAELTAEDVNRPGAPVCSFLGGMVHIELAIRPHPQPFDFVLPEAPDLPLEAGAELVPSQAMRSALAARLSKHLDELALIARLADGPVYQFEAPPPAEEGWMLKKQERKLSLRRQEDPDAQPLPSVSRFLRYKLWRLNTEIMRDHAEQLGVRFVTHPQAAVDDEGFLRPKLCRGNGHGNEAYGALLLEQMRALQ